MPPAPPKSAQQIARALAEGQDAWHLRRTISELERLYTGKKRAEANGVGVRSVSASTGTDNDD